MIPELRRNLIYTAACNKNWSLQRVLIQIYAETNYIQPFLKLGGMTQGTSLCLKWWQGKSKWITLCLNIWKLVMGTWPVILKLQLFWMKRKMQAKWKAISPVSLASWFYSCLVLTWNSNQHEICEPYLHKVFHYVEVSSLTWLWLCILFFWIWVSL